MIEIKVKHDSSTSIFFENTQFRFDNKVNSEMSIYIWHYFKPLFNEQSVNPLGCHAKQRLSIITKALRYKKRVAEATLRKFFLRHIALLWIEFLPRYYLFLVNPVKHFFFFNIFDKLAKLIPIGCGQNSCSVTTENAYATISHCPKT